MGHGIVKNLGTTLVPSDYTILEYSNATGFLNGVGTLVELSEATISNWSDIVHFGFFYATLAGARGYNGTTGSDIGMYGYGGPGQITEKTEIEVLPGDIFYVGVASRVPSQIIKTQYSTTEFYICGPGRGGAGTKNNTYAITAAQAGYQPCGGGGASGGSGVSYSSTDPYKPGTIYLYGGAGGDGGCGSFIQRVRNGVSIYVLVGNGGGGGGGGGLDGNNSWDSGGYAGFPAYNGAGAGGQGKTFTGAGRKGRTGQSAINPYGYTNTSTTNNYAIIELPIY